MICFMDKTFCSASCSTVECHRNWNDKLEEAAKVWWDSISDVPPVAFSDFSDTCPSYRPKDKR